MCNVPPPLQEFLHICSPHIFPLSGVSPRILNPPPVPLTALFNADGHPSSVLHCIFWHPRHDPAPFLPCVKGKTGHPLGWMPFQYQPRWSPVQKSTRSYGVSLNAPLVQQPTLRSGPPEASKVGQRQEWGCPTTPQKGQNRCPESLRPTPIGSGARCHAQVMQTAHVGVQETRNCGRHAQLWPISGPTQTRGVRNSCTTGQTTHGSPVGTSEASNQHRTAAIVAR